MIVSPDKTRCTIERLALENGYLLENLSNNIQEILKRKEELKQLEAIYNFEVRLRKKRKCYAFEVIIINDEMFDFTDVFYFLKDYVFKPDNKIRVYTKLSNIIYVKLKSDELIENKEWNCQHYILRQIDPKNIIKKCGTKLNIDLEI